MNPGSVVLNIYQGSDDNKHVFYPSDLTNYTGKLQMRHPVSNASVLELSSPSDGITITVPTSITSLAIGLGAKTITTQSGLSYSVGKRIRIYSAANAYNYMEGLVYSYTSTSLVLTVDKTSGSGTIDSWKLSSIIDLTFSSAKTVLLEKQDYGFDLKLTAGSTNGYIITGIIKCSLRYTV